MTDTLESLHEKLRLMAKAYGEQEAAFLETIRGLRAELADYQLAAGWFLSEVTRLENELAAFKVSNVAPLEPKDEKSHAVFGAIRRADGLRLRP